jgi:hypothetical protein
MLRSRSVVGFLIAPIIAIILLEAMKRAFATHWIDDHSLYQYVPSPIVFFLGLTITSYTTVCRSINPFLRMHRTSRGSGELLKSGYSETTIDMMWSCVSAPGITTFVICISALCLLALRISVAGLFGVGLFHTESQVSLRQLSYFPDVINGTTAYLKDVPSTCWQQMAWSLLLDGSASLPDFTTQAGSFVEVNLTNIDSDITNPSLHMALPVLHSNLSCSTNNDPGFSGKYPLYWGEVVTSNRPDIGIVYGHTMGSNVGDYKAASLICYSYSYRYVK